MIVICTCIGILIFLAHTAIKAGFDILVGIGYIVNFLAWTILSIVLMIHFCISIIVSFILFIIYVIIGGIGVIISSIPILNVLVYTFGQWAWSFFSVIPLIINIIFAAYQFIIGFIVLIITTFGIIVPALFNDYILHCRLVITPMSIISSILSRFNLINVSILSFFEDLMVILQLSLSGFAVPTIFSAPMGQGFMTVLVSYAMMAFPGMINIILFISWNFIGVLFPFGISVITFLVSIPLDLILSFLFWTGLFFLLGVAGTI